MVVRILYGLFLFSTGIMTLHTATKGIGGDVTDPAIKFLNAARDTGYLLHLIGIFKIITGLLLLIPRTAPLATLVALPYSFNMLLWVSFVARGGFILGLTDFLINLYLLCCYCEFYKPIFRKEKSGPSFASIENDIPIQSYTNVEGMKIISPTLNINQKATEEIIEDVVKKLEGKEDPFVILEQATMTYMQVFWTEAGYSIEYQEGDIFHHYRLKELLSQEKTILAMKSYLKGHPYRITRLDFERMRIATTSYRIGHIIGSIFDNIIKALKGK